jgi:uncharacterized protein YdeI (YjbR/CyaY-like superfamily)
MNQTNPKVDFFFDKPEKWQEEYKALRNIMLQCDLTEELKWGVPCYSYNKKNVVLIHGFKEYCAILFVKGALLKDPDGILIQQTENVQAARQVRFTGVEEIHTLEQILKTYIEEAIKNEKSGLKVVLKKAADYAIADEFQARLEDDPELNEAFYALTPGRQRAYLLFFSAPKQSQTRVARIEKSVPQIMAGKGLND